jgi:putative aminopeptidase FrvX
MFINELSNINGVSGNEDEVRKFIIDKLKKLVDKFEIDSMGNLYAFKKGKKSGKKIMLAAHMDEVGFMVTGIEQSGDIRFRPVGGIEPLTCLSKRVIIGKNKIPGVIGVKATHLNTIEEEKSVPKFESLRIDAGFSSKEEASSKVNLGDYIAFDTEYYEENGICTGKGFDDRAGCSILMDIAGMDFPYDTYLTFTVQEEVGLRGARIAGNRVFPDICIVVEGTGAGDFPSKRDIGSYPSLGSGPVITLLDRSLIVQKKLVDFLLNVAKDNRIPYQFKRPNIGATDAGRIHISKTGVPSMVLAVPVRYIHSPCCIMLKRDYNNTLKLIEKGIERIEEVI